MDISRGGEVGTNAYHSHCVSWGNKLVYRKPNRTSEKRAELSSPKQEFAVSPQFTPYCSTEKTKQTIKQNKKEFYRTRRT